MQNLGTPTITPSGRKVSIGERERKERKIRRKNVNSGHLVLCRARKPLEPKSSLVSFLFLSTAVPKIYILKWIVFKNQG